jgi:geranylgeranyl transferase type-2 subunit beta
MLMQVSWINGEMLVKFILQCQDADDGGISDRPCNMADIFHTFFGISGLSLLGYFDGRSDPVIDYSTFRAIDPTYALPKDVVEKYSLVYQVLPDVEHSLREDASSS